MPSIPSWFHQLDEITTTVETYPEVWLDRKAIESLFRLSERSGRYLMASLGGRKVGKSYLITKRDLLLKLYQIRQSGTFEAETRRRGRLVADLERTRRMLKARQVIIPVGEEVWKIDGINTNTRLMPGRLEIDYHGTEDLLRQLMELAQAIMNDYTRFEAITETTGSWQHTGLLPE